MVSSQGFASESYFNRLYPTPLQRRYSTRTLTMINTAEGAFQAALNDLNDGVHIAGVKDRFELARQTLTTISKPEDREPAYRRALGEDGVANAGAALSRDYAAALALKPHFKRVKELAKLWSDHVQSRHHIHNGAYPLRNIYGEALKIAEIEPQSVGSQSGAVYSSRPVKPFFATQPAWFFLRLKPNMQAKRAALYEQYLDCVEMKPEDLKSAHEQALIGQNRVVARRAIPAGTCLGIYGGTLLSPSLQDFKVKGKPGFFQSEVKPIDDTYLMGVSDGYALDGDNILSRMNTTFEYDEDGRPVRQAGPDAYNVDRVDFRVRLENGLHLRIPTAFTTRPIAQGEELRWNYGYTPEAIRLMCSKLPSKPLKAKA